MSTDATTWIQKLLATAADVVVQKSLAEGFGLTVAEAMWKERPVVASRIGGIQDQIVHGDSGLLLDDPTNLAACGAAINHLLVNPDEAQRIGQAGSRRVRENFLPLHHFRHEDLLFGRLLDQDRLGIVGR